MPSINKNGTIFMQAYITRSLDSIHQPTLPPPPSPIQNPEPPENIQKKKPAVSVEEGEKANTVIPNENPIPQERRSPTVNNTLVDIPFLPTEAKYENYNSARSTLNPILDKIKSDPMNKIVITVNVESPSGYHVVRPGTRSFFGIGEDRETYIASDLAADRVERVKKHLRAYNIPESQFEVKSTIDPDTPPQMSVKTTTYD
jgi:hypothetical protein